MAFAKNLGFTLVIFNKSKRTMISTIVVLLFVGIQLITFLILHLTNRYPFVTAALPFNMLFLVPIIFIVIYTIIRRNKNISLVLNFILMSVLTYVFLRYAFELHPDPVIMESWLKESSTPWFFTIMLIQLLSICIYIVFFELIFLSIYVYRKRLSKDS